MARFIHSYEGEEPRSGHVTRQGYILYILTRLLHVQLAFVTWLNPDPAFREVWKV